LVGPLVACDEAFVADFSGSRTAATVVALVGPATTAGAVIDFEAAAFDWLASPVAAPAISSCAPPPLGFAPAAAAALVADGSEGGAFVATDDADATEAEGVVGELLGRFFLLIPVAAAVVAAVVVDIDCADPAAPAPCGPPAAAIPAESGGGGAGEEPDDPGSTCRFRSAVRYTGSFRISGNSDASCWRTRRGDASFSVFSAFRALRSSCCRFQLRDASS